MRVLESFGAVPATTIEGLETQAQAAVASAAQPSDESHGETTTHAPRNALAVRRPEDDAADLQRYAWR
jgi:hypothetical protein